MASRRPEWSNLSYLDPAAELMEARRRDRLRTPAEIQGRRAFFRKREGRAEKQRLEACLFAFGWSCATGLPASVAMHELSDYDCVLRRGTEAGGEEHVPVQLKELPPTRVDPDLDFGAMFRKLGKYVDSEDLVVALYVNRRISKCDLDSLLVSKPRLRELWILGATSPAERQGGQEWSIVGSVTRPPKARVTCRFTYPDVNASDEGT